jgi:alkylation response protein AidB-like acyl-CoA dehydrogenase
VDFSWTEQQQDLYARVLAFARARLTRTSEEGPVSRETWQACGGMGLLGLCVSDTYGGLGLDATSTARVIEALGRGSRDMGLALAASAHLFACAMPLEEHASEPLKQSMLPRLASGEWVGAGAMTEPEAGSDAFSLRTTALRDDNEYVLNGVKIFTTNAPLADVILIYAKTDVESGYLGVSAFAAERDTPGLSIGPPTRLSGMQSAPVASVYLQDCRVPACNMIGQPGQGSLVFNRSMLWERACLFAAYLGLMEHQLESTIAFTRKRRQFGKPLSANQAVSHRLVDMKLRLESARLLLYHACWVFDSGRDAAVDISLAKLAVSEAAVQSGLDAVQLHGGLGYATELGFEQELRDAVPATIFSGTSQIQRELIARALGL